jgi:hypothetical protein
MTSSEACLIWTFAEDNNISLGKLAPIIFGMMVGREGFKQDSVSEEELGEWPEHISEPSSFTH